MHCGNNLFVDTIKGQMMLNDAREFIHIRCCTHIINLIDQDASKEMDGSVEKTRESVKYINGSQLRKKTVS